MSKRPADKSGKTNTPESAGEEGVSFEDAMERLEGIVERVERGEVSLEDALKEYETGMALIKRCKDLLARAQQRVEELSRQTLRDADSD